MVFSVCASDFGLHLSIAFCTVHVVSCVLVKIFIHTTVIHAPCATIKSYMLKHHCHTFLTHVLIDLAGTNA